MSTFLKALASVALAVATLTSFGQTANSAAAAAAATTATAQPGIDLDSVNSWVEAKCREYYAAKTEAVRTPIRNELGQYFRFCSKAATSTTTVAAKKPEDNNAAVLAQLRADLERDRAKAAYEAEIEKLKAAVEEANRRSATGDKLSDCSTSSRILFVGNDGKMTATCKGAADEIFRAPAPHQIIVQPAIIHQLGGRPAAQPAPAAVSMSGSGAVTASSTSTVAFVGKCGVTFGADVEPYYWADNGPNCNQQRAAFDTMMRSTCVPKHSNLADVAKCARNMGFRP